MIALSDFEQALDAALNGRGHDESIFESVKTGLLAELTDENVKNIIADNLPLNHSKYIQRARIMTEPGFPKRNDVVVCFYYKNYIPAFGKTSLSC